MTRLLTTSWRDSSKEVGVGVIFIPIQHQVEGSGFGKVMAFLPILQSVSPETPEFWGLRCDLESVMAKRRKL